MCNEKEKLLEELQHINGFTKSYIESIKDGLVIIDTKGHIVITNSVFCNITGYTQNELLGLSAPFPFWPPEFYNDYKQIYNEMLDERLKLDFEAVYLRKDNSRIPVFLVISTIKNDKGASLAYLILVQDISAQKKELEHKTFPNKDLFSVLNYKKGYLDLIDENLLKSQLDTALDLISDGLVSFDNDWCYTYINKRAGELIGRDPESLLGKHVWTEFPEAVGKTTYNACYKAVETKETQKFNDYYETLDLWFENRVYPHSIGLTLYFTDITDRKKIEERLIESEKNLDNIINNIGDPIFVKDDKSRLIFVNDAFCKVFNHSKNEIIGKTLEQDVDPEERISFLNIDKEVLETGIENINIEKLTVKGRKTQVISTKKNRFIDSNGNKFIVGIIRDITQLKEFETQLLESEYNLRQSQIVANIGSYTVDLNTMEWTASTVLEKIFGIDASFNKTIDNWSDLVHIDDREEILAYFHACVTNKLRFDKEYRIIKHNTKQEIWVHGIGEFVFDNDSNPIKMIGTIQDITERKQSQIRLQKSEQSLLEAQKIAKVGNYNLDLKTGKSQTSLVFKEISGYDLDSEITLEGWTKIMHPEDVSKCLEMIDKCIATGDKFNLEYRIFTNDTKTLKWIHGLGEVVYKHGEPTNFFGTIQDITDRKNAEIELKAATRFTENLVMSMQEGLLMLDSLGKVIKVNDSLCNILGYSEDELIGLELPYPFAKPEDFEKMQKIKEKVTSGEVTSFQLEFFRKNGEQFTASFLAGNIRDDKGEVAAIFATIKDVSEEEKSKALLEEVAVKSTQKKNVMLKLAAMVGEDPSKSFKSVTKYAAETLNVARVSIWKFNENRSELECKKLFLLDENRFENGHIITHINTTEYFKILDEKKTILINDVEKEPVLKQFAQSYIKPNNIKSLMDVLINSADGYYGIICFEHIGEQARSWTADEQEFATSIASIVSSMVESYERKITDEKIVKANTKLLEANNELNKLREQLEQENIYLRNELDLVFNYEEMVYGSVAFSNVLTEVETVASTNATVLLLGESGTGKELLARAIHNTSLRNNKPLIKVNCSAIPRELIESELFGHKKGSFTGAFSDKIGKFELADGGTLFLDEIGELPIDMQPKILRFLQEGEIEVVGGVGSKTLDVRVIAATNRDLLEEIQKKRFREDLYFRLNVFPINIPALRDRKDDIPLLVEHFVDKFNKAYDKNIKYISDDAMSKLKAYSWPGNVRELENLIERASILSTSQTLVIPGFETTHQKTKQLIAGKDMSLDSVLRNHILQVLESCKWKISGKDSASDLLGLRPSTLRDKMSKLGIHKPK
ncbi:PAS domain S-box protein [Winogradskyella pulchriflava]|uniref:PAS domain S-box protein n=1 Tax=Winogradskyella pulchriflava TaxID=1110688 RepID=A0ABV6Q9D8_9FLAO